MDTVIISASTASSSR